MPNEAFCLPGNTAVQEILERQDEGLLSPGHIYGLKLSNNADDANDDIDIAPGTCKSTVNSAHRYAQAASRLPRHQRDLEFPDITTKQLDVLWAPGNGGGRSASSLADGTWHFLAIGGKHMKDRIFIHDSLTESSIFAAMPGGYTAYRNIMSVVRASSAIKAFTQYADGRVLWSAVVADRTTSFGATTAITQTLTVPLGLKVRALFSVALSIATNASQRMRISSLDQTDEAPSATLASLATGVTSDSTNAVAGAEFDVETNTSGQIRIRGTISSAIPNINTHGFIHPRGCDA